MTTMSIPEVYNQLEGLVGQEIRISGRLLVSNQSFVAASREAFIRGEYLEIRDDDIIRRHLLNTVPPYGGGPFIYNEAALITGTIGKNKSGFELKSPSACIVQLENQEVKGL